MPRPILLLGFAPFDGHERNPSQELAHALAAAPEGLDLRAASLPVSAARVPGLVSDLLETHAPRAVIAFGLYGGPGIAVERLGVNLCDFRIPDEDGDTRTDTPVCAGGPDAYFATLPTRALVEALTAEGLDARLSLSAGAYLCNFLLYWLLHRAATGPLAFRAGFVHLPPLPGMRGTHSIPFASLLRAGRRVVQVVEAAGDLTG